MAYGKDTETTEIVWNVEHPADHRVSRSAVVESSSTHLDPTGAQAQILSLILHGDSGDSTILNPTVVLHGITQHDDSHWGILEELTSKVLGIGEFLEIQLIVDYHKLPGSLALRRGSHQTSPKNQFQVVSIDFLFSKLTVTATQLRQIFEICHTFILKILAKLRFFSAERCIV
jgi:hypothetical protein